MLLMSPSREQRRRLQLLRGCAPSHPPARVLAGRSGSHPALPLRLPAPPLHPRSRARALVLGKRSVAAAVAWMVGHRRRLPGPPRAPDPRGAQCHIRRPRGKVELQLLVTVVLP